MKKLIMSRGTGKTTRLIQESAKSFFPILCADKRRADHIKLMAKDLGLTIPEPRPVTSLMFGERLGRVYIDDAEDVLTNLLGCNYCGEILALTISPEICFD